MSSSSPERRTGDQRDQLHLAFDAIIDCANIENLIEEGVLVQPVDRTHFVHDLQLDHIDISSGDFPVAKLAPAIIKSSKHVANAVKLLEFLVAPESQAWYAEVNDEYPVVKGVKISAKLASFGTFKGDAIALGRLGENNRAALQLMDRADWK